MLEICMDCTHKCGEYNRDLSSDKAYYDWEKKAKECRDYLDYASNQPMRDGEEICSFLNDLD